MAKKPVYNSCYISGEAVDIRDARLIGEGETWCKITYKLDVEVAENQIITVEVDKGLYGFDGTENKQTQGLRTICNELKLKAADGTGDKVNCSCKLVSNDYYMKGNLVTSQRLQMDFCNREKDGKKIEAGTVWKIHTVIKEINDKEDHVEVVGLINEFMSTKSIKGHYVSFRIYDKDIIEGFKSMYKVGDIAPLEGEVKQVNEFKTFDVSQLEDLEMLSENGFGSARTKNIEENKRRVEINKQRAEMREAGGKYVTETYFEVTGGTECLQGELLEGTPFENECIETMELKIQSDLAKSKERDEKKNADLPF